MVKYLGSVHLSSLNEQNPRSKDNVKNVVFTNHSQFQKVHNIFSV